MSEPLSETTTGDGTTPEKEKSSPGTRAIGNRNAVGSPSRASSSMCMLQGVTWLQVEAMPIWGF